MRIITLHNDYLRRGGESESVRLAHQGLIAIGVQHSLFEVSNQDLQDSNTLQSAVRTAFNQTLYEEVFDAIRSFKPDLIHVENTFPKLGGPALRAVSKAKIPWVRTFRNFRFSCIAGSQFRNGASCTLCSLPGNPLPGILFRCYQSSLPRSIGAAFQTSLTERNHSSQPPRVTIFTSEFLRKEFMESTQNRTATAVVRNAVAGSTQLVAREAPYRRWDCCYVGRIDEAKGTATLLSIIAHRPDLSFVIAGDGPYRDELGKVSATNPNVTFLGEVEAAGVHEILSDSRVTLVPSMWKEPYGRLPFEAVQYKSIPIVADVGGLAENMLLLHLNEMVVSSSAVDAWARKINLALGMSERKKTALLAGAQEEIDTTFSPQEIAKSLVGVYEFALGSRLPED